KGNFIGTDVAGTGMVPNINGVAAFPQTGATTIGGTAPGAGNLISGNTVGILGGEAFGLVIQGNRIGTDIAGTSALGNSIGIEMDNGGGHTIGGTDPGAGNLISGNTTGVDLVRSKNNLVKG